MKKYFLLTCLMAGNVFFLVKTAAQCDFTVSATVTPSTCIANGTVTATVTSGITLYNTQYSLLRVPSGEVAFMPSASNVFTGVAPGTYKVEVGAFCDVNKEHYTTKQSVTVTVAANYTQSDLSFAATGRTAITGVPPPASRKPYRGCSTGKIVMLLKQGNQTSNPTFRITAAPSGVTIGAVNVTRYASGSLSAGYYYTLDGGYPAGNYTVTANDGCYTASSSFNLGELADLPNPVGSGTGTVFASRIYPWIGDNVNCDSIRLRLLVPQTADLDFYQYYRDSLYEFGLAPLNGTPTAWYTWKYTGESSANTDAYWTISFPNFKNYYSSTSNPSNTLSLYFRVKNCPSISRKWDTYIITPTATASVTYRCNDYSATVRPWTDYDGVICYPVSVVYRRSSDNAIVYQQSNVLYNSLGSVSLSYGTSYSVTFTDKSGTVFSNSLLYSFPTVNNSATNDRKQCNTWQNYYYYSYNCYPIYVEVTNATTNALVARDTIKTSTTVYSSPLEYGVSYKFTFTYPGRIVNGVPFTSTYTKTKLSDLPSNLMLSVYSVDQCSINQGTLRIAVSSTSYWPVNTKFTVTGPAPFGTRTYTMTSSSYSYSTSLVPIPPGNYTLSADYGCGAPTVINANLSGGYSVPGGLTHSIDTACSGLTVTPTATLIYNGNPVTAYICLQSGPSGYDLSIKKSGESFVFSTPGRYVLSVISSLTVTNRCPLVTDTIVYEATPPTLDAANTTAYACVRETPSQSRTGEILIAAKEGVPPYKYELLRPDYTVIDTKTGSGRVRFHYGSPNTSYLVRITDDCGRSFYQQVTIADLETAKVVYSTKDTVCYNDDVELRCLTLGTTTYTWTGPNGFTSTAQNPVIQNVDSSKAGYYKVSVTPEYCGRPVTDSVFVRIFPPINLKAYENDTVFVEFCPGERILLGRVATGGSGVFSYQWERSTNGTAWSVISGGSNPLISFTTAEYVFQSAAVLPQYSYFRCRITDAKCGSFYVYYRPKCKACYFPVNPDLKVGVRR